MMKLTAKQLLERINSNDSRSTAKPYLLLLNRIVNTPTTEDHADGTVWVKEKSGDYLEFDSEEDVVKHLIEGHDDSDEVQRFEDEDDEDYLDRMKSLFEDDYRPFHYTESETTENVFFTDVGYKEHLNINKHNLGKHTTYGIHAFRNIEIESLFQIIEDHAKAEDRIKELEAEIETLKSQLEGK